MKCYDKYFLWVVKNHHCHICGKEILPGKKMYMIVLTWGDGRYSCQQCYDQYEKEMK